MNIYNYKYVVLLSYSEYSQKKHQYTQPAAELDLECVQYYLYNIEI